MPQRRTEWLELPGVLTADQVRHTGAFIASQQQRDGAIPWYVGGPMDHWDHIESAMGLAVAGRHREAVRAFEWSACTQRSDGSWPMLLEDGRVVDDHADTNQCAYIAVGLWHLHQVSGHTEVLARFWPTVERALNFVIRAQRPDGAIAWAVGDDGRPEEMALVTGCSSIAQALECGLLIAGTLGHDRPRWRWAHDRLAAALRAPTAYPEIFADRSRYSMDWYYPVLTGSVRGEPARDRLLGPEWDRFVVADHGALCVDDQPWATAGESAELVAALHAVGETERAHQVLRSLGHLRDEDSGGYWTGRNLTDGVIWPRERTTWSAAAVLLAVDALAGSTGGSQLFVDAGSCDDELPDVCDGAAS